VRRQAVDAAAALRQAHVWVDLAPVADTISTPRSFLGTRSFGSDSTLVGSLAAAFVSALQGGGVAATAKHFPGLGSAVTSTDDRAVTIGRGAAFLTARLAPFQAAIAAGAKLVMVSNASYPALDPSGVQAVFSHAIVTDLLRDRLGFDGVVVTDALDAKSVAAVPHAPARALAAGVDLMLYSRTPGIREPRPRRSRQRDRARGARDCGAASRRAESVARRAWRSRVQVVTDTSRYLAPVVPGEAVSFGRKHRLSHKGRCQVQMRDRVTGSTRRGGRASPRRGASAAGL